MDNIDSINFLHINNNNNYNNLFIHRAYSITNEQFIVADCLACNSIEHNQNLPSI